MAFFVVEGNIGAGKSTFLKKMGSMLQAQIVYEPVAAWQDIGGENLLDAYYKNGNRWAYTFQTYAILSRIIALEEHAQQNSMFFQLAERSVYSDHFCFAKNLYEAGVISELEWNLYSTWFGWLVEKHIEQPAGFIYLRTDPPICFERLKKRKRSEEKLITVDYLALIHEKHEQWFIHKKDIPLVAKTIPTLVINCDEDFEENSALQEQLAQRVATFVGAQLNRSSQDLLTISRSNV